VSIEQSKRSSTYIHISLARSQRPGRPAPCNKGRRRAVAVGDDDDDDGGGARAGRSGHPAAGLAPDPGAEPLPALASEPQGPQGKLRVAAPRRDAQVPHAARLQHAGRLPRGSLLQVHCDTSAVCRARRPFFSLSFLPFSTVRARVPCTRTAPS
jgi:hypothetical protein